MTLAVYESWELKWDFLRSEVRNVTDSHFHFNWQNAGLGQERLVGYISVWNRGLGPGAKVISEKGQKAELTYQLLWLPCLLSKYKVWPTMQHSTIRKTLIMPTRTGFLPGTTPWTMPRHCSGRCQELSSMDNCGTVLKHALGPFWFMLIVTFIKADSNLKDDGHWLFQAVLRRNRILR